MYVLGALLSCVTLSGSGAVCVDVTKSFTSVTLFGDVRTIASCPLGPGLGVSVYVLAVTASGLTGVGNGSRVAAECISRTESVVLKPARARFPPDFHLSEN